jgi:hypothetical protein
MLQECDLTAHIGTRGEEAKALKVKAGNLPAVREENESNRG